MRECLKQKYHTTQGVKDHKLLRCDKHGYFKPVQRQNDGEKICVDPRGNVRKSSGVKGKKDCLCKNPKHIPFSNFFQPLISSLRFYSKTLFNAVFINIATSCSFFAVLYRTSDL